MENCIKIGNIISRLCATLHATITFLNLAPLFIQSMIFGKKIPDAATVLNDIEFHADYDSDPSGRLILEYFIL